MNTKIHIGTSGYNNRFWQPLFYPDDLPRSKWFEFNCGHFSTYELNVTFYKFPTVRTLQNWYKKSPAEFRYSVKAPKVITHLKRFEDCESELAQFYSICREGLQDKLDCILFQFPPSFSFTPERLQAILQYLDRGYKNVIEFRHASWWRNDVFAVFSENSITFCSVNYPGLPDEIVETNAVGYLRLHGNERLFYSGYSDAEILNYINEITVNHNFDEFYIYFNNTAGKEGINNALTAKILSKNTKNDK